MTQDMDTFGARLASFDLVLQPEKRRGSSAKTAKAIAWPHRRPSPAELAHAGFFYNPYETNPDNTTCFLCRRALDGWEEEDNPITEHLKHSPDCGWALMMDIQQHSSNPAEIEDPTSETIRQARMATFGEVWPHDGKRGWVCQSEKMVDGGWYFCPTEESDDLASCAYCKLSLDGWEPKDDPFDEHYRRSSDCSFFVFALPGGKKTKASRSKKARTSKVSRQSTQSVSEAPVSDLEVIEPPAMAQPTTKSKSTKKSSKSKTKTSKSKKAEPEPVPTETEVDNGEQPQPEIPQPKRATRGKKRASEADPDQENSATNIQETEHAEAPTKKKAKKSRESAQESGGQDLVIADVQQEEDVGREPQEPQEQEEPKKTRGTSKKKASAKLRKASSVSSTAKQTAKHEEPEDVDMYAALEAELYNAGPSQSNEEVEQKPAKKSKSKKKKKNASPEPPAEAVGPVEEPHQDAPQETETTESPAPEEPVQPKTKRESSKREKPRGRSSSKRVTEEPSEPTQPAEPAEPAQPASEIAFEMDDARDVDVSRHESFVSVEITSKLPEEEPPAEPSDKETKKKQKKKSSLEKSKKPKKSSKTAPEPIQSVEEQVEERAEEPKAEEVQPQEPSKPHETQEVQEQEPDPQPPRRRSSRVPPKTAERYSDILEEKQYAKSLASSRSSGARAAPEEDTKRDDPEAVSPIPSASKSTPSLSPQSSDAENQPPSMKPSASRPVAVSPSKQSSFRVPLAPSTPSPSKRAANAGGLTTSHPWKPVDIDEILFASNSDKENIDITSALNSVKGDLTSPEKKMTVEQWITWNAKDGEERLRRECERLVGQFEKEGARAMHVLEGIECMD